MNIEVGKRNKVFCIGFQKTGTSTVRAALKTLGYTVTGPNNTRDPDISHNLTGIVTSLSYKYDAFQDNPWPLVYQEMDALHPGSKFILTVRDSEAWIKSVVRHFGTSSTPMRELIYGFGSPVGYENTYVRVFESHNREVKDYFSERGDDLLVVDLTKYGAWAPLCAFLDRPIPRLPFPHSNSALKREKSAKLTLSERSVRRAYFFLNRWLR